MKWTIIIIMVLAFTVLGCTPSPKPDADKDSTENVTFNEAMGSGTANTGEWLTDYNQALAQAKELKRPVLINFTGSDWCIWCKKLASEVFTQVAFKEYAKANLVLLKVDFPKNLPQTAEVKAANEAKAKEFKVEGFPTIVLVSSDGK